MFHLTIIIDREAREILRAGIVPPLNINAIWSISIKSYLNPYSLRSTTETNLTSYKSKTAGIVRHSQAPFQS